MRDVYFKNRSYGAIYSGLFGDSIASALFSFFSGTYLYSLGLPLYGVLMFFGLEFGLRGAFSPLGGMLASRWGVPKTMLVSYVSLGFFFFMLAFASQSLAIGFLSFIFMSLAKGLSIPCKSFVNSQIVDNQHRGGELSLEMAISTLGHLFGIGIGSFLIGVVPYYWIAVLATLITLSLTLPYFWYLNELKPERVHYTEPYRYLFSSDFRPMVVPLIADSFSIVAHFSLIPLLVFIIADSFQLFGVLLGASILINIAVTLLFGSYVDRAGNRKAVSISSSVLMLAYTGFLFVRSPVAALAAQSLALIGLSMFKSGWETAIHKKIFAAPRPMFFSVAKEMTLCFSEVVILSFYALIAYFFGAYVFMAGLLLGIVGLIIARRSFRFD